MPPVFGRLSRFLRLCVTTMHRAHAIEQRPSSDLHAPARNRRRRESTSRDYTLIRYSSICQAIAI